MNTELPMNTELSKTQQVQEAEYILPYHYVPVEDNNAFTQVISWSWGMNYLAGLQIVLSELRKCKFSSVLDVGCGDGRFLREVALEFPSKRTLGVDYSKSAISLAKALNPSLTYKCLDITSHELQEKFDVVTMVEVLEHIPVEQVQDFLMGVKRSLVENGKLILTVPHVNKRLQEKHYQHFSCSSLNKVLSPIFEVEQIIPFDRISRSTSWFLKLLGYTGDQYIITNKQLNHFLYKKILRNCLESQPEEKCGRLLAIARVKS